MNKTIPKKSAPKHSAEEMAIAVLVNRIQELPPEDKADLFECAKVVFTSTDEEEIEAASEAMNEIIDGGKEKPSDWLTDRKPDEHDGWKRYVASKIREHREAAGLTQKDLAERSGLTQSHISRIENGDVSPSDVTRRKIADALKINPTVFDPDA